LKAEKHFQSQCSIGPAAVALSAVSVSLALDAGTFSRTLRFRPSKTWVPTAPMLSQPLPPPLFPLMPRPPFGMHSLCRSPRRSVICDIYKQHRRSSRRSFAVLASRTYEVGHPAFLQTQANNTQDAVDLLNTLQTPFEALKKQRDIGIRPSETANSELRKYLDQTGYSVHSPPLPSRRP
jgi:hypothetical protein